MNETELVIALLSFLGTCAGSFGGLIAASRLTNYRIKQLELKVDKHNNFAQRLPFMEEQIKTMNKRVTCLENSDERNSK